MWMWMALQDLPVFTSNEAAIAPPITLRLVQHNCVMWSRCTGIADTALGVTGRQQNYVSPNCYFLGDDPNRIFFYCRN